MRKLAALLVIQASIFATTCPGMWKMQVTAVKLGQEVKSSDCLASVVSRYEFMSFAKDALRMEQAKENTYAPTLEESDVSNEYYALDEERLRSIAKSRQEVFDSGVGSAEVSEKISESHIVTVEEGSDVKEVDYVAECNDLLQDTVAKIEKIKKRQAEHKVEQRISQEKSCAALQSDEALCCVGMYDVPDGVGICDSKNRTYMGYHKVTDRTSAQYALLRSEDAWTDTATGFRMVGDRICIAVGSGYATEIGTKIDLVLADGTILKCIMGDIKADIHTDDSHRFQKYDGSVAEFIVDYDYFLRNTPINAVNYALNSSEAIVKVVNIGG